MFKLARRRYLQEIFSGGSGCTGDCGQGRRCTCDPDREESAGKPTNGEAQLPNGKTMNREDMDYTVTLTAKDLEFRERARSAGIPAMVVSMYAGALQKLVEDEREECAKLCDSVAQRMDDEGEGPTGYIGWVDDCAVAIRERGKK
jgi:hypothetical protein